MPAEHGEDFFAAALVDGPPRGHPDELAAPTSMRGLSLAALLLPRVGADSSVAVFSGAVRGRVVFIDSDAEGGGVQITTELCSGSSPSQTAGHKWHIHLDSPVNASDCLTAGAHWAPDGAETAQPYLCSPEAVEPCYLGDLSGMLGTLAIPSSRTFATLGRLPPAAELRGRSVVVHAAAGGAERLACADITSMDEAAQTVPCSATATVGPLTKCSGPPNNSPVSSKACPDEVFGDCPPGCDLARHVVDPWGQPLAVVASIVVVGIFVGSVYVPLRDTRMKRAEEKAADVLESGENPIAESDDEDGDGDEESADSAA